MFQRTILLLSSFSSFATTGKVFSSLDPGFPLHPDGDDESFRSQRRFLGEAGGYSQGTQPRD